MPIYVYQCTTCGKVEEKFQKLNAPAPTCCTHKAFDFGGSSAEECVIAMTMQKLMTAPAFNFQNGVGTDMGLTMAVPGFPLPPTS